MPKITKVIHVPVVLSPAEQSTPIEQIEVIPDFYDFRLGRFATGDLVDQYGRVNGYEKVVKKWLEALNGVLKAKCPIPAELEAEIIAGKDYQITHSKRSRLVLDAKKVIAKFGEEAVKDCYSETPYTELRVGPREPEVS